MARGTCLICHLTLDCFALLAMTGIFARTALASILEVPEMNDDDLELIHGTGNVFRDLGLANAEAEQLKDAHPLTRRSARAADRARKNP